MSKVRLPLGLIVFAVVLNIIARLSPSCAEFYVNHIFPIWVETYGRITGVFPFSVGELMLYLAVVLAAVWVLWGIGVGVRYGMRKLHNFILCKYTTISNKSVEKKDSADICDYSQLELCKPSAAETEGELCKPVSGDECHNKLCKLISNNRHYDELCKPISDNECHNELCKPTANIESNNKLCKLFRVYTRVLVWIAGIVSLIMTLNCFLLYQVPVITERFDFMKKQEEASYGTEELTKLRDYVVEQANDLAGQMERDAQGYVVCTFDPEETARKEMQRLGKQFPSLCGYYPKPKKLLTSSFFSQQYIMGYYFPFSMEANYNSMMYITNVPSTLCHELSHLKGFILEDEANLIGYLACVDSDEPLFRYSAYLSVLGYLDDDFYHAVGEEEYLKHPAISAQVKKDDIFLTEEAWAQVEENAIFKTETVQQASYDFLETTLTLNGVEDGIESYSRVVQLLLIYYGDRP